MILVNLEVEYNNLDTITRSLAHLRALDESTRNITKENGTLCSQFRSEVAKGKSLITQELIDTKQRLEKMKQTINDESIQKSPKKKSAKNSVRKLLNWSMVCPS